MDTMDELVGPWCSVMDTMDELEGPWCSVMDTIYESGADVITCFV